MTTVPEQAAQAVYAAEDLWEAKDIRAAIRFGDWYEIWPFYYMLAEALKERGHEIEAPSVKPRKNALKAHYDRLSQTVFIPPYDKGGVWALKTSTAIHEFAHHLDPEGGHGPSFRDAMIECVKALGWDHELLERCYAEAGVTKSAKGDKMLDLVSKILTHADGASTQEEKLAFLEGAESLAAKHSIDLALIRKKQADQSQNHGKPVTGKLFDLRPIQNKTHRGLAVELASAIGHAHGARCTIRGRSWFISFMGYPEDIQLTELMVTRITPMMFDEAEKYLRSPEHKQSGTASVSARITFCQSFIWEVSRRLKEAVKRTEHEAVEQAQIAEGKHDGSTSTEIALRNKELEVLDYVEYEFKRLGVKGSWKGPRTGTWDHNASSAGKESARTANLFGRKELT